MRFHQKPLNSAITAVMAVMAVMAGCCMLQAQEEENTEKTEKNSKKEITPTPKSSQISKLQKINKTTYQLGEITIDKKNRTISFEAEAEITAANDLEQVNSVEYVIVTPAGKIHETLFITNARPIHLNIAFKLLGYKENKSLFRVFDKNFPTGKYQLTSDEDKAKSFFTAIVSWTDQKTKKTHAHNLNDLLETAETKKTFAQDKVRWSYGGSFLHQGQFAAEINNDLIAILTDRGAVANYVGKNGEEGDIWLPVADKMPAKGTKVTITITPEFPLK